MNEFSFKGMQTFSLNGSLSPKYVPQDSNIPKGYCLIFFCFNYQAKEVKEV